MWNEMKRKEMLMEWFSSRARERMVYAYIYNRLFAQRSFVLMRSTLIYSLSAYTHCGYTAIAADCLIFNANCMLLRLLQSRRCRSSVYTSVHIYIACGLRAIALNYHGCKYVYWLLLKIYCETIKPRYRRIVYIRLYTYVRRALICGSNYNKVLL